MQKTRQENEALKEILPQAEEFVSKSAGRFNYYEGLKDKTRVGYALKVGATGYGGDIEMLVGIDEKGVIGGIEILSQQETPGLGSRITEIKQGQTKPWFLQQFKGKSAGALEMSDSHSGAGIQAITGATISSKTVLEAVKKQVEDFLAR
jgi:electron transport complex protein RnfG